MLLLIVFSFVLLLEPQQLNAQTITSNQTGNNNGFYYSFWNQGAQGTTFTGTPTMTLETAGNYSVTWSNTNNFTAGKGWAIGNPNRVIHFSGSFDGGSNGYLAVYGWTKNALIEYYVVECYGSWTPPGGTSLGSFSSDGGTYNIYLTTRTNQPSIVGTATFQQFWSVRTSKRSSGTVTFANHVAAWKAKGMNLGSVWDYQIMETEGYHSSGSSNITVSGSIETALISVPFRDVATEFSIFPNPVKDKLNFTLPGSPAEVRLLTVNGDELLLLKTESLENNIDMTKYNAGVYFLYLYSKQESQGFTLGWHILALQAVLTICKYFQRQTVF